MFSVPTFSVSTFAVPRFPFSVRRSLFAVLRSFACGGLDTACAQRAEGIYAGGRIENACPADGQLRKKNATRSWNELTFFQPATSRPRLGKSDWWT